MENLKATILTILLGLMIPILTYLLGPMAYAAILIVTMIFLFVIHQNTYTEEGVKRKVAYVW